MNRGGTLPGGSQSAGTSQPTDSPCTFLSFMFTEAWRLLEVFIPPPPLCLYYYDKTTAGELTHLHLGSGRLDRVSVRLGGRSGMTKLRPWLSWRVPPPPPPPVASLCPVALRSSWKPPRHHPKLKKKNNPFCHVNVLHSLDLRCTFV